MTSFYLLSLSGTIVGTILLELEDLVFLYFVLVDRSHSYGALVRLKNNQLNNQSIFCFVYHLFFFSWTFTWTSDFLLCSTKFILNDLLMRNCTGGACICFCPCHFGLRQGLRAGWESPFEPEQDNACVGSVQLFSLFPFLWMFRETCTHGSS